MTPEQFQKILLHWFDEHGRKHLPWQQNKTPYRVWISEIMLQQTQVNTVVPYFDRFMQTFPDIYALAHSNEDQVLHLWAGLGYYSRPRNLYQAAQLIVQQYNGKFPDTLDALKRLPGIGQSTAGAILSLAFNQPAVILDGNVKRVLSRFYGIKAPINEQVIEKKLWALAKQLTLNYRPADYTQAMMDLGATICTRRKPKCSACPLHANCIAHEEDIAEELPLKKASKPLKTREATFLILKKKNQIFLQKRKDSGIWRSLWCLPEIVDKPDKKLIRSFCKQHFSLAVKDKDCRALQSFRHTFTHYHLEIFPVLIEIKSSIKIMDKNQQIWYKINQPQSVGLPKPIQLIMRSLDDAADLLC